MNLNNSIPTRAIQFIRGIDAAVDTAYDHQDSGDEPPEAAHSVQQAFRSLEDAKVQRDTIHTFLNNTADRILIDFPDDSHVTVIASWGEDQIDIFNARITDTSWKTMPDQRVSFHPWGRAGKAVFDGFHDLQKPQEDNTNTFGELFLQHLSQNENPQN